MKNFNKKLAVMILKNTIAYELEQINIKIKSDRIIVFSPGGGAFHATEIIYLFAELFSCYVQYNSEYDRCELVIF
jgi:hypothetical protein